MRLALLLLLVAGPAMAHEARSPLSVRLELTPRRSVAHVVLRLSGEPAKELVEQLDADASGGLDAGERARLVAVLEPRVVRALTLSAAGKPRPLRVVERQLELSGGEVVLVLELRGAALRGEASLAVEWPDPRAVTPVVLDGRLLGEASRGAPLRFTAR